jgi:hypothetical protein
MNINMETVVVQNTDIDATDIDGEKAMMNIEKGQYFMLNGVASRVWDIISKPSSVKEILADLLREYDVDAKTCEQNILEFLQRLQDAEIITVK